MRPRSTFHLWLAGGVLIAFWLLVAIATATVAANCGPDCGDNGGRGAFIGFVAAAPLAALGLTLVGLGVPRRGPLLRLAASFARFGAALLAIIAAVVAVHGADQLIDSITGSDLHAIGRESYERSQMAKEGAASGVAALVLLAIAASGLLPGLAVSPDERPRAWARRLTVALAAIYLLLLVPAVATTDVRSLPSVLLGLVTAAGAALVLTELRRRPY